MLNCSKSVFSFTNCTLIHYFVSSLPWLIKLIFRPLFFSPGWLKLMLRQSCSNFYHFISVYRLRLMKMVSLKLNTTFRTEVKKKIVENKIAVTHCSCNRMAKMLRIRMTYSRKTLFRFAVLHLNLLWLITHRWINKFNIAQYFFLLKTWILL